MGHLVVKIADAVVGSAHTQAVAYQIAQTASEKMVAEYY